MCGIFGIWKLAETGYDFLPLIKKLMDESKVRGTDATGVAFLAHKEGVERSLFFHKLPLKPQEYAKTVAEKVIPKDFKAIIVHNRHATQGDPKVNNNNHPFVAGGIPFAFIHNGIITSKYTGQREKPAETDSVELFCEIWDEVEKAPGSENRIAAVKAGMEKHEGSATIAVLFSECIVLGKHSNPCWLAYVPDKKCILFASTDTMLEHALDCILEPFYGIFRPYNITEMKNDTVLKIDDTGVVLGGELEYKIKTYTWSESRPFDYDTCAPPVAGAVVGQKSLWDWQKGDWRRGPDRPSRDEEEEGGESSSGPGTVITSPTVEPRKLAEGEVVATRADLKPGDLVEDLLGWNLKFLVVYEVVEDAVWGIFGKDKQDAQAEFFREWTFKTTDKGGHLRYSKSDQFVIWKRGLTNKRLKKMEKKGTKEKSVAQIEHTRTLFAPASFKRGDTVRVVAPGVEGDRRSGAVTEIYEHGTLIEVEFVDGVRRKYPAGQLMIISLVRSHEPGESHQATDKELNEDWEKYLDARGTEAN